MEYTREEWDAVHVVNGLAYRLRDEYISHDTLNAQADYQDAVKRFGYAWPTTKAAAKRLEACKMADVRAAILAYRAKRIDPA